MKNNLNYKFFIVLLVLVVVFLVIHTLYVNYKFKTFVNEYNNTGNKDRMEGISPLKNKKENSSLEYQLNRLNFTDNENPIEIKELNSSNLIMLKNDQPVLYRNAKEGYYYVKFPSWVIIYNPINNSVVDRFRFQSINIQ